MGLRVCQLTVFGLTSILLFVPSVLVGLQSMCALRVEAAVRRALNPTATGGHAFGRQDHCRVPL